MTFIIVCGGTAGHINPGLSIAEKLQERIPDAKILFIGAGRDMEKRLIPEAGYELINIEMRGIKRSIGVRAVIHNAGTVINVIKAGRKAAKILKNTAPDAVIGTGGYICYPVIKAAAKRKIPVFIHESNACPGMTVRMLSGIADKVMITYPGYEQYYKRPERIVITGTPVRKEFSSGGRNALQEREKPVVVSFWGSLGAERMNKTMAGFIKRNLEDEGFFHIHAAGNSKDLLTEALAEKGITEVNPKYADIREYITDMPDVMKSADLVLCRAGGITLAEITAIGKPSILIPSPFVPDKAQYRNAAQLTRAGAAVQIDEAECDADLLYETVTALLSNRNELEKMSRAAGTLAAPNAASDIADIIIGAVK